MDNYIFERKKRDFRNELSFFAIYLGNHTCINHSLCYNIYNKQTDYIEKMSNGIVVCRGTWQMESLWDEFNVEIQVIRKI